MKEKSVALVTGANRGIGLEVCRQLAAAGYLILLTGRDGAKAEASARELGGSDRDVYPLALDTLDDASVATAKSAVESKYGRLDVLVNNAGGNFDSGNLASTVPMAYVRETLEMNLIGTWRVIQGMLPLLRRSSHGRIVNVSSGAGAFESDIAFGLQRMGGAAPAYAVSKAALTALTVKLATELKDSGILVNAACPGWTATYPGAEQQGARPVSEGAAVSSGRRLCRRTGRREASFATAKKFLFDWRLFSKISDHPFNHPMTKIRHLHFGTTHERFGETIVSGMATWPFKRRRS